MLIGGLYCCGVLRGVGITALVDSGATATMISDTVYNKLPLHKRPLMNPVGSQTVAANGEDVSTIGFAACTISFNGKQFSLPVIVANINAEAVLDLDFMQKFSCSLNAKECTLNTDDIIINCFMRGKMGCYRITAVETVSILSNNEILIPGCISEKGHTLSENRNHRTTRKVNRKEKCLRWSVSVKAAERVPVRLMNATNKPVVIKKGTTVGTFESVDEIHLALKNKE